MKTVLFALAALTLAPVAHAQVYLQAPPPPRAAYPGDYWRSREGDEWRRRTEFREEEHRRMEWRRAHCVRDYRGQEYCRR